MINKLQSEVSSPLYLQLYDTIKSKIDSGEYKVGEKIPSEAQLSENYGISRITVRSALEQLVNENILVKKHGKGTYVSMPVYVESTLNEVRGSFTKSCIKMGKVPKTSLLSVQRKRAGKYISKQLGVNEDDLIIVIKRVRCIDDIPSVLEIDYFRKEYDFMIQSDIENNSLLDLLRKHTGIVASTFNDVMEIKHANKEQSVALNCMIGAALLLVSQTVTDDKDQIIYFNEQYIRSDIYKYAVSSRKY